jgi:hypothetical protein
VTSVDAGRWRHSCRIGWFVIRARRVEEHSLAADEDKLFAWAKGTMTVRPINGVLFIAPSPQRAVPRSPTHSPAHDLKRGTSSTVGFMR